jgi:farnesyl-diphosphate farnesyltransferase
MVIQELHPELLVPVALFYLILRGLDTIEDDMTISLDKKDPLMRDFKNIIEKPGWTFDGNGPDEKDRQLLVEFNVVIEEFMKIKPEYRAIIKDIANKMGGGMAHYQGNVKKFGQDVVQTVDDYNLYCHYVAGLVGEGLTRLFVEGKLANPLLLERDYLHESMGLFLQKTNIIRDIREDYDDRRRFYPKEIWSKHVDKFEDLFDPANRDKALACSSDMVLNALEHVPDCLMYLAGLREQSVFNFCAIPQTMAIGTLALVFQNPNIFEKNVKLTKGETCKIMLESTQNLQMACTVFRRYLHRILKKNNVRDPNFLKISIACSKGEQFIEKMFPTRDPKAQSHRTEAEIAEEAKKAAYDAEARRDVFYMFLFTFGALFVMSLLMVRSALASYICIC